MPRIILLGPPGAGKGTQGILLASKLGVPYLSLRSLLDDHIRRGTPWGKEAEPYVAAWRPVPDQVVIPIVVEAVVSEEAKNGFVLDSFPKNYAQGLALIAAVALDYAFYLEVGEQELAARCRGRLSCTRCPAVYHLEYRPPRRRGLCDECDGELFVRPDDDLDALRRRTRTYLAAIKPLVVYLESLGILYRISGEGSVSQVSERLISVITNHSPQRSLR